MFMYNHRNREATLNRKTYLYAKYINMYRDRIKFHTTVCISFKKILTWNLEVSELLCKMGIFGHDLNCIFWKEIIIIICLGVMNAFQVVFQC